RPNGRPVSGVEIRAFDKDLRSLQNLREDDEPPVLTAADGSYRIEYTAARFRRAEKKAADLIVRAYSADGVTVRAESPLRHNPPPDARIDLFLARPGIEDRSEFEQLVADVTPLLEGVPLARLTDDDLTFLQRETDEPADRLVTLRRGAELELETRVPTGAF